MTRQNRKTFLHKGFTTRVLAVRDTRMLRVWCPRAAAPVSATNKAGKTPLVPRTGQSTVRELVERCSLTTRRLVKENAATAARVQKSQTCDMKQPRGAWLALASQGQSKAMEHDSSGGKTIRS